MEQNDAATRRTGVPAVTGAGTARRVVLAGMSLGVTGLFMIGGAGTAMAASTPSGGSAVRAGLPAAAASGPTITQPASGTVTTTQTPTISGSGLVGGDSVTVSYPTSGSPTTPACQTTVSTDSSSGFTCTPTSPLPTGSLTLTATEMVSGGGTPQAGPSVTVTIGKSATLTAPAAGSTTANQTPAFSGSGQPSDPVTVKDATGNTLCSATVTSGGTWSCTPARALAAGATSVTVTETNPDGSNGTTTSPVSFTVGAPPPATIPMTPTAAAAPSAATPAADTSSQASSASPSAVASGSGGQAAEHGVPLSLVAGLSLAGLVLLGLAWRRRPG